jgi:Protein of unknown function (DUF3102)
MPKPCPAGPSDYRKLPPDVVATLKERAAKIRAALQRSLLEVGRELIEAKADLSHGQFTAWVERETGLTARTAQMIMAAYKLCLKNENFSLLPKSALYILGAADLPPSTIAAIDRRIEAGDPPCVSEVRSIVHETQRSSPVNIAIKMNEPPEKATVVDLAVHRVLAPVKVALAEAEQDGLRERVQGFRDRIEIADIAVMLNGILDSRQVYRLVTMIRAAAPEATLNALADALERL